MSHYLPGSAGIPWSLRVRDWFWRELDNWRGQGWYIAFLMAAAAGLVYEAVRAIR